MNSQPLDRLRHLQSVCYIIGYTNRFVRVFIQLLFTEVDTSGVMQRIRRSTPVEVNQYGSTARLKVRLRLSLCTRFETCRLREEFTVLQSVPEYPLSVFVQ
jgi:hypothetical protein